MNIRENLERMKMKIAEAKEKSSIENYGDDKLKSWPWPDGGEIKKKSIFLWAINSTPKYLRLAYFRVNTIYYLGKTRGGASMQNVTVTNHSLRNNNQPTAA